MTQGLETSQSPEKDLDHYVDLLKTMDNDNLDELIAYFRSNPDDIQEVAEKLAERYPGQPVIVATMMSALVERLIDNP
jgi:hypothetical protein